MPLVPLVASMALGQFDPYVRSHVDPQDPTTQCLYWTADRIVWSQEATGNPGTEGDAEFEAIRRAFKSWKDIFDDCGNLTLEEGPRVDERKVGYVRNRENHNVVLYRTVDCHSVVRKDDACWKDKDCENKYDCWDDEDGIVAVTLTTYNPRSGIIVDSDISFNAARWHFTAVDPGTPLCVEPNTSNCMSMDLQNAATHEVGHFIGLDHTRAPSSVMIASAFVGETTKRTIDEGSRGFVCSIYAKGGESQACLHPFITDDLGPKSGCDATGGASSFPVLVAWGLARFLRQRWRRGA
ncbi:matrixin family metalloprotease [Myxococcus stipitatus]|uniref:myxosortase-dependent metalloprotease, MXAN_2677/MXAN_2678 family n=1 Tax=Myxococcus stipitatus TaxID=83455 RepID=UPI001F19A9D6|nr:myxosortase-dependent metalloprotease, MXAN_2677/MXAN_2678 family [Myxococcus stipitatus]MCE9666882.1 matrixin family metalloprotease [Myxococcus stipitatus]